jgi:4-hydroxyphenylacetate 3-monooxygenase
MGIRTGTEYLSSLSDGRNIIHNGKIVRDVTSEPGFRNTAKAIAQFYDFQHLPEMHEVMTYETLDGDRAGLAFIEPRSKEDLRRRGAAYAAWADVTCGLMGRSPDYMNSLMMALGASSNRLAIRDRVMGKRAYNLYLDARRRDLCFTHTFIYPFVDRFKKLSEQPSTLRIVRETSDGAIVTGARAVATLAPFSNSNLAMYFNLAPTPAFDKGEEDFAISFTIAVNAPGLSWVARDCYDKEYSHFDAPLSTKSDEMDCMAVFEECLIPWDNIFIYKDLQLYNRQSEIIHFSTAAAQQVLMRAIAKTRLLFGLAHLLAESSQINKFVNVQEKLGEFSIYLQNLESLALAMIEGATQDPNNGLWLPNPKAAWVSLRLYPEYYQTMINHLMQMGASGYVGMPQEQTLENFGLAIENYFRGATSNASEKVSLFRLAWDLIGSNWGRRQELYERFFFGDISRWKIASYHMADKSEFTDMVYRLLTPPEQVNQPYNLPQHIKNNKG